MARKRMPEPLPHDQLAAWQQLLQFLDAAPDADFSRLQRQLPALDLALLWNHLYDHLNQKDAAGSSPVLSDDYSTALQAAAQLEQILHAPKSLALSKDEQNTVQQLAAAELDAACKDKPAGFRLLVTYQAAHAVQQAIAAARDRTSSAKNGLHLSSANMTAPTIYAMQVDAISRNLARIEQDENEVYVGKASAGKGQRRNVSCIVNLDFPESIQMAGGSYLSSYDKAILNGISSMMLSGVSYFTIPMLYGAMTGLHNPSMDAAATNALRQRLEFMRRSMITIDYTDEVAARMMECNVDSVTIESYLLPMSRIDATLNGRSVQAYHLLSTPPLYQYASLKRQISVVPLDLLSAPLNNNSTTVPLKNYILSRIEGMKNPHNRLISNKILFHSLFEELGEAEPTKLRRKRIRDYTETFLNHLTVKEYIVGYEFTKNGRSIDGVLIHLNANPVVLATSKPILPEAASPGRIRPARKKKKHKIIPDE